MKRQRSLTSISVVAITLVLLCAGISTSVAAADKDSIGPAQAASIGGANTTTNAKTKYVIFRDDDIYANVDALKVVNQVHVDKNVPVTLAIVPHPNTSQTGNQLLTNPTSSYLRTLAINPLFEFAQHGYTHIDHSGNTASSPVLTGVGTPNDFTGAESPYAIQHPGSTLVGASASSSEFSGRPYTDQYNAIKQGRDDITEAFNVTPTTFVPPYNDGDDNTVQATSGLGFTLYSTGWDDFSTHETSLYGVNVQSVDFAIGWDSYANWQTGMQDLTQQTDAALDAAGDGEHFVIYYHFWAFTESDGSIDPGRVALFSQYLDHLKSRGDVSFTTLGGQELHYDSAPPDGAVAVRADGADSIYLFAKGASNALWWRHGTPSTKQWTEWKSLGGVITADPAVVSRTAGAIDVVVRGSDGALYHRSTTDSGAYWAAWSKIGGQLLPGTGPTAYAYGYGTTNSRIGWFVTGTNNALYHMWSDNAGTHSWVKLGGYLTSSPAATSRGTGLIDVVVRGGNGSPYELSTTNGGTSWGAWQKLSGGILSGTSPAVTTRGSGLDLFVTGNNRALYHLTWKSPGWSTTWENLEGYLTSSPSATSRSLTTLDVFVRGSNNYLWERSYASTWGAWSKITS